jgi:hypothetical protein
MAHEHVRARRAAGITLAWLGCAGLALSVARAWAWDAEDVRSVGSCVVSTIEVGYDVGYDAAIGGYAVTSASLSGVPDGCAGREVAVTLRGVGDLALAEGRASVTVPSTVVTMDGPAVPVEDMAGVSLAMVTDAAG